MLPVLRRVSNHNLAILSLHRVVTVEEKARSLNKPMMTTEAQFRSLIDMVRRYGHPISLSSAIQQMQDGAGFEPGTVVITFDDGYYDVYQRAFPLLKEYQIPATIFTTTGVIGDRENYLWWDEVDYCLQNHKVIFNEIGEGLSDELSGAIRLIAGLEGGRSERIESSIRETLYRIPVEERNELVARIRNEIPDIGARPQLMLSWDNVREMSGLIEIGNHTVHHHLLNQLEPSAIVTEIADAKAKIEQETGYPCPGLAYPSGAYTNNVIEAARECGVEYAVTTRFTNNSHTADLMTLGRKDAGYLSINDAIYPDYFKVALSGVTDWYRQDYTWTGSGDIPPVNKSRLSQFVRGDRKPRTTREVPLIVHVIFHLAVGGLENGLVNLVNRIPRGSYRHAIICLTDYTDFRNRIRNPDVDVYILNKRPGKDWRLYTNIWRLFRRLRPDIVHTRNLSTLETQLPALLAGVPHRVHGEHGRDITDIDGTSKKYQLLRRIYRPLIHQYIALSMDLTRYLANRIGVPREKLTHILNGVDTDRFRPGAEFAREVLPENFSGDNKIIIGTVGRMEAVKDQTNLVHAFIHLVKQQPENKENLRLIIIGDGALRLPAMSLLEEAGLDDIAWLPGEREDVPELLRSMDVFVLPSLAEGISNTILEAMASGLPVVATDVGGNSELVDQDKTGYLVPRADPVALSRAIQRYTSSPGLRREHGERARRRCEGDFSIETMVRNYQALYDGLMQADKRSSLVSTSQY